MNAKTKPQTIYSQRSTAMKRLLIFLPLFLVLSTAGVQSENNDVKSFRMGLSSNTLGTIKPNDYMASFKSWATMVGKEHGLPMKAEARLVDVDEHLRNILLNDQLDALTLTVQDLMFLKVQPVNIFVARQENEIRVQYVVIVHKNSSITDLEGLKGGKIITHNSIQMVLARPWLEVLLAGHARGPLNRWLADLTVTENPSKCILQVFFRQAHAALVTKKAFELACELNPQLRKDLNVLSVSQPFIPNLFIFRPSYRGQYRDKLETAIVNLHTTPGGRQILSISQSSRMEKHPTSILEPTQQFLIKYHRLVNEGIQP